MSRKGGFRNQEKRQQVRNKGKFELRKQQLLYKEQMSQAKNYYNNKKVK